MCGGSSRSRKSPVRGTHGGRAYYIAGMSTRSLDNPQALRIANGYFDEFLSRIPDEAWELPTPCNE